MSAYNMGYIVGVLAGILFGVVVIWTIFKWTKKDHKVKCEYDERQAIVRGNGYKIAFFVVCIANFVYGALGVNSDLFPVTTETALFLIAIIGIIVQIVYCIWNDAYFSLNEQKSRVLIAFLALGFINAFFGIKNILSGDAFTDGKLNGHCMNLVVGLMFVIIFAALLIRKLVPLKSEEDEE